MHRINNAIWLSEIAWNLITIKNIRLSEVRVTKIFIDSNEFQNSLQPIIGKQV